MTTATKPTGLDAGEMTRPTAPHRRMTTTATIAAAAEITSTTAVHARMAPSRPDKIAAVNAVNHLERLLFD